MGFDGIDDWLLVKARINKGLMVILDVLIRWLVRVDFSWFWWNWGEFGRKVGGIRVWGGLGGWFRVKSEYLCMGEIVGSGINRGFYRSGYRTILGWCGDGKLKIWGKVWVEQIGW